MEFKEKLMAGNLIKRYKRFLADIKLEDGRVITAHCTNSGSMKSCLEEDAPVYVSPVNDPKRKTKFTWEMIYMNEDWIGINTSHPNLIAYEAIRDQQIPELIGYTEIRREVKFGDSRFDVHAKNDAESCFVEVKNVTYKEGEYALFPDAVTTRGLKHLNTLKEVKAAGYRAVMLYIIQRSDVNIFAPANDIDPAYAQGLKDAYEAGIEILPYQVQVSPERIILNRKLPFEL
jgi:sugar fermentation stimulation protein A